MKRVLALVLVLMLGITCGTALAEDALSEFLQGKGLLVLDSDQLAQLGIKTNGLKEEGVDFTVCEYVENQDTGNFIMWYDGSIERFALDMTRLLNGGVSLRIGGSNQLFIDVCNSFDFDVYSFNGLLLTGFYVPNVRVAKELDMDTKDANIAVCKTMDEFQSLLRRAIKNN